MARYTCCRSTDGISIHSLFELWPAERVIREYLAELVQMIEGTDVFDVLCHIDYPVRTWPSHAGSFEPRLFEEEFRAVLRGAAHSGRTLEYNTSRPSPWIVNWWCDEGGRAVCFGSDAHEPGNVARGFEDAASVAAAGGFTPGRAAHESWTRSV